MPEHSRSPSDRIGSKSTIKTRRSHQKSRNGCGTCKRRKIKCDETKPICTNCTKFAIHCDFVPKDPSSDLLSLRQSLSNGPKRRGRPRKDWDLTTNSSHDDRQSCSPPPTDHSSNESLLSSGLSVKDVELLHHFSTNTYTTFGDDSKFRDMWRINIPKLGFEYDSVLYMILAVSALHIAHLEPQKKAHNVALAEKHAAVGIRKASALISCLDADNSQALYASATLICYYTWARGPQPGDFLVFSERGPAEWLPLLRGVRSVIELMGPDTVFAGALAVLHPSDNPPEDPDSLVAREAYIGWETPIQLLRELVAAEEPASEYYLPSLTDLSLCYEAIYGKVNGKRSGETEAHGQPPGWLYRMNMGFVDCLQQKEPLALIILAYFCPLLGTMEFHWFMEGWSEHILYGVHDLLDETYLHWLHWPMAVVKEQHRTRTQCS